MTATMGPLDVFLLVVLVFVLWGIWEAWLTHRTPPVDPDPHEDTEHMHPHRRFEDRQL